MDLGPQGFGPWQMCARTMADIAEAPRMESVRTATPARVFSALARHRKGLDGLTRMGQEHGEELAEAGFSPAEFDELIALKRARYEYLQGDPARVREVMEVFTEPLLIVRGTRPHLG